MSLFTIKSIGFSSVEDVDYRAAWFNMLVSGP